MVPSVVVLTQESWVGVAFALVRSSAVSACCLLVHFFFFYRVFEYPLERHMGFFSFQIFTEGSRGRGSWAFSFFSFKNPGSISSGSTRDEVFGDIFFSCLIVFVAFVVCLWSFVPRGSVCFLFSLLFFFLLSWLLVC